MTPQELHAAIDARRKTLGWPWWKVSVALDVSLTTIDKLKRGRPGIGWRQRAEEWLGEGR